MARSLEAIVVEQGTWVRKLDMNRAHQVKERRARLGLNDPLVSRFRDQCEFISLGCNCCVSFALQALDLKEFSYPLDWVRSPIEGVIELLESNFVNFFAYSFKEPQNGNITDLYGGTSWGGSFLHHDIDDPKIRQDFTRRIERFLGRFPEVPPSKPRVFVRVANSTSELARSERLYKALCNAFPKARIYLLILVDLQAMQGPILVDGVGGDDVIHYMIHESNYDDPDRDLMAQNEINSEAYAAALAEAMKFWSGRVLDFPLETVFSLTELHDLCQMFWAGDPARDIYTPTFSLSVPRIVNNIFEEDSYVGYWTKRSISQGSTASPRELTRENTSCISVASTVDQHDPLETSDHEEDCQCNVLGFPFLRGYDLMRKHRAKGSWRL
jgi:hypothetical protein